MRSTQFQFKLRDADLDELDHWVPVLLKALQGIPLLRDVATDQQIAGPTLWLEISRDAVSRLGVSLQSGVVCTSSRDGGHDENRLSTLILARNQRKNVRRRTSRFCRCGGHTTRSLKQVAGHGRAAWRAAPSSVRLL